MSTDLALPGKIKTVRDQLQKMKEQFEAALPKHISVDRMLRVAMTCLQKNPALLECTQTSLFGSLMTAAQLGLEPNTPLHECVMIPFWNNKTSPRCREVQLLIEYQGLLKLVRRSGEIGGVLTGAVYEKEEWRYERGLNPVVVHVPSQKEDKGKLIAVYAIARFKDGAEPQFDWMWTYEVEKHRARSRAANDGPWVTDYEAMCKKTVLRRLCKTLPASIEVQRAVDIEEKADLGLPQEFDVIEVEATDADTPKAPPRSKLDQIVEDQKPKDTDPQEERPAPSEAMSTLLDVLSVAKSELEHVRIEAICDGVTGGMIAIEDLDDQKAMELTRRLNKALKEKKSNKFS